MDKIVFFVTLIFLIRISFYLTNILGSKYLFDKRLKLIILNFLNKFGQYSIS